MGFAVLKAKPPARPKTPGYKVSSGTIARLTTELTRALAGDLAPESWLAVVAAIDRSDMAAIENAIVGNPDVVEDAWGEMFVQALGSTYLASANAELARIGAQMRLELYRKAARSKNRFPGVPHSDKFIRSQAAKLVVKIKRDQRQAIREALIARYNRKRRPETLVQDLRRTVGLDPRRARALRNYEDKLTALKVRGVGGKVETYRKKLLQNRAETIARTESVAIENTARVEAWSVAIDAGEIPAEAEQEWVSTGDPCPDCEEMDGQRVPVGEDFTSTKYGSVSAPGLHPNCYCVVVLRAFV